jgi:hypothetical protein
MIEEIVGTLLLNHRMNDPEWRFDAGYVAEMLENGAPLPSPQALGGLSRIAGGRLLTREQVIKWARAQETSIN